MNIERALKKSWERVRAILFAPFELGKWFRLGFVAWLVTFVAGGTSFNFSYSREMEPKQLHSMLESLDVGTTVAIVCGGLLVIGVVLLVLMWIGARAQFMFIDDVIHNRAAVAEPWKRYREGGNSFFKIYAWLVSVPVVLMMLLVLAALIFFWGDLVALRMPGWEPLLPWLAAVVVLALLSMVWFAGMLFYREFGVPIMMSSGCDAREVIGRVWQVLRAKPGPSLLYLLLRIVMEIVFFVINVAVVLATCCMGALPYVNSVLTLPLAVFRQSFILECLCDLAPEYVLWRDEPPPLEPVPGS